MVFILLGDLHIHSNISDGKPSVEEILRISIRRGLDIISITDHNSFKGSIDGLKFINERYKGKIILLPGNEVRTEYGDVLIYCLEPHQRIPRIFWELYDFSLENNCAFVPAHPFDFLRKGIGKKLYELKGKVHSIECYNAGSFSFINKKAIRVSEKVGFSCIAGSDAHISDYIGVYKTLFLEDPSSIIDVLEYLKKGAVKPVVQPVPFGLWLKRVFWGIERRLK